MQNAECGIENSSPNPVHIYKKGNNYSGMIDYHPDLTVTAIWANGYSETWTSCAGTVSIIDKPEFVAIELLPDITIGNIPLTVNFMISDRSFAKNATITSYEFDFGDGSPLQIGSIPSSQFSSPRSSLDELKKITFTHTYTTRGDFSPTLKVKIKENPERVITIGVPVVSTSSLLVSGIEVVEPQDNFVTNQPIQTFKIATQYTNPFSNGNRLTIHVTDEENNESVTELDPNSLNQTISLSERVNNYWFELVDSTGIVQKSLSRKVILDTIKPSLEIISPSENELVLPTDKVIVSGVVEDELFDSISYRVNSGNEVRINNNELEELEIGKGKKAFGFTVDPTLLNIQIEKIEILAKDKAGNVTGEEIKIEQDKKVKLLSLVNDKNTKLVYNDGTTYSLKQGEPFELVVRSMICDDKSLPNTKGEPPFELAVENLSNISVNGSKEGFLKGSGAKLNSNTITDYGTLGDIDGCSQANYTVYESFLLNNNQSSETYNPNAPGPDPSLYWPLGLHNIGVRITSTDYSKNHYGTTLEGNSTQFTANFMIQITRETSAEIVSLEPKNLILNQDNNVSFSIKVKDSIPFNSNRLPVIKPTESAYLQTPSGSMDFITLNCLPVQGLLGREIIQSCTFTYKPQEYLSSSDKMSYSLTVPVELPSELDGGTSGDGENKLVIPAAYSDIFVNFETPAKITSPLPYTVIHGNNYSHLIKSEVIRENLPTTVQNLDLSKIKNLAKYGIRFGSTGNVIPLTSKVGNESVIKGITAYDSPDKKIINFDSKLNFNLSTAFGFDDIFKNPFKSEGALGPLYLYTAVTDLNNENISFNYSEPLKLVLLDKSKLNIKNSSLKNNQKTGLKILNLKVTDNIPFSKKYPLEVLTEPFDINGQLITFENMVFPVEGGTLRVNNLPTETSEVKVILIRSDAFLNKIQEKISLEGWTDVNILSGNKYKEVQKETIKLSDSQITKCSIDPNEGSTSDSISLSYILKSLKALKVKGEGLRISDGEREIIQNIKEIIDPNNTFGTSKEGSLSFSIPNEWSIYSEVLITIISGDESDSCKLKIKDELFFNETSKETNSINLSFVSNGTAIIPDDAALNIKSVSFPFSDNLSLKDYKQLLKDLKLLSDDNNNGYDLETQEATYEVLYIIDQLRCALTEGQDTNSDLRAQVIDGLIKCGVITSNYQEYILSSAKQNLPIITSLIDLSNTLKQIGTQSPPANIDLPDSLLLRAIAVTDVARKLLPHQLQIVGFAGLLIYNILANLKLKAETQDTTCTNTFGIVDRRFFIGKDLDNNDVKRTNIMISVSATNNLFTSNPQVVEPLPSIPFLPGIFFSCLQQGTYNFQLQFNGQNTFSVSGTVPAKTFLNIPHHVADFWGGVFRTYRSTRTVNEIVSSSMTLLGTSYVGDLGFSGVYLTRLPLEPTPENQPLVSKVLRLINVGLKAPDGEDISLTHPQPCEEDAILGPPVVNNPYYSYKDGYIDLAINTKEIWVVSPESSLTVLRNPSWLNCLLHQYVKPLPPSGELHVDNQNVFIIDHGP